MRFEGKLTKKFFTYTALLLLLGLGGCAGAPASETVSPENDTALETYNRAMFSFNNKLDKFVIRPVAKGYRAVTNEYFRQRVTNFLVILMNRYLRQTIFFRGNLLIPAIILVVLLLTRHSVLSAYTT